MTNTTNESEAMEVWRKARRAFNIVPNPYPNAGTEAAARVIATALEVRDAELKTVLNREADTIRRYDAKLDERDARIAELEGRWSGSLTNTPSATGSSAKRSPAKPADPLVAVVRALQDGRAGPTPESYAACLRNEVERAGGTISFEGEG